jgi:hypothetical protein
MNKIIPLKTIIVILVFVTFWAIEVDAVKLSESDSNVVLKISSDKPAYILDLLRN